MQTLGPFNLEPHVKGMKVNMEYLQTSFQRLCQVLGLDKGKAVEEYTYYLPMAVAHYRERPDTFDAWKTALLRPPRHSRSFGMTLKKLVQRVGAWGASTPGAKLL